MRLVWIVVMDFVHLGIKEFGSPECNSLRLARTAGPSKFAGPHCKEEGTDDEVRCVVHWVVDHVHRRGSGHVTQQLGRHRLLGLDGG